MNQRSNEWFQARRGLFTSSGISEILKPKGIGKTGESYIYEKAAEKLGAEKPEVFSKETQWGNDWEYTGLSWYQSALKVNGSDIGFVKHPKLETGCSPDMWIHGDLKGVEIKCPYTIDKHLKVGCIRDEKDLLQYNDKYYWQVKTSMLVMNCEKWDFVSFDPRYPDAYKMFVITIHRDENDDLKIIERVKEATERRDEIINKLRIIEH
jgi:hypothetical protein